MTRSSRRISGRSLGISVAPDVKQASTAHLIAAVTDTGTPPLTRYHRLVVSFRPGGGNPGPAGASNGAGRPRS